MEPMKKGRNTREAHTRRNVFLLSVASTSFITFAVSQLVGGLLIGSLSLLGDALIMMVDCLSYALNMCAERQKLKLGRKTKEAPVSSTNPAQDMENNGLEQLPDQMEEQIQQIHDVEVRSLKLQLYAPLVSVVFLLILSVYIIASAVMTLMSEPAEVAGTPEQQKKMDDVMISFSSINLVVDFINVGFFYRANHLFGWKLVGNDENDVEEVLLAKPQEEAAKTTSPDATEFQLADVEAENRSKIPDTRGENVILDSQSSVERDATESESEESVQDEANMNMCSAYIHLLADTLRSCSVLGAALISKFVASVSAEKADAAAALAVMLIVCVMTLPLLRSLWILSRKIFAVEAERRGVSHSNHQRLRRLILRF